MRKLFSFQVLILLICVAVYLPKVFAEKVDKEHNTVGLQEIQPLKENPKEVPEKKDPIVYITKSGKKYHASYCSCLKKSKISIKLSEAKSRSYTACSKCNPPS